MLDFDNIDDWAPKLAASLRRHVPPSARRALVAAAPRYVEDARDQLFDLTDRDAVIDGVLDWMRSEEIAGYHGTRMTDAELASVRSSGLIPLKAEERRHRLTRALSAHPRWPQAAEQLDAVLQAHGRGGAAGRREGQSHLTLSRCGLVNGFKHYLTYGSEFDQHVAHKLLGAEGKELLADDGAPLIIRVAVPGPLALDAAHPCFSVAALRARAEVPNMVNEFLMAWSYRLAHPGFQCRTLRLDCGMVFRSALPGAWIIGVERLAD